MAQTTVDLITLRQVCFRRIFLIAVHPGEVFEDLGPDDFVRVECIACGHDEMIPKVGLTQGLRLPPQILIVDLEPRLRFRECDAKGKAVVTVSWAE